MPSVPQPSAPVSGSVGTSSGSESARSVGNERYLNRAVFLGVRRALSALPCNIAAELAELDPTTAGDES